jgi:hypothetical protein
MIFLTETDFIMQDALKTQLITNNASVANTAEGFAIDELSGYLSGRFDTALIFAQTGTSREPSVVRHLAALTLHHIHRKISPQNIPIWVKDGRDDAKSWGEMIMNNQLNPGLPLLPQTSGSGTFRFGGAKKVTKRF